eukprot:g3604.t1
MAASAADSAGGGLQRLTFEELSRLNERKHELKSAHAAYLREHPEVTRMLGDFMSAALLEKPVDIFEFAERHFLEFQPKMKGHRALVFSGPPAVGKKTLISRLVNNFPEAFGFCVSHTTRLPREDETDGVNFHFVNKEKFNVMLQSGSFIAHTEEENGDLYGTSVVSIGAVRQTGKVCILDVGIDAVKKMKSTNITPRYVFINPPSLDELENRIRDRGTAEVEDVDAMLKTALSDMEYGTRSGNFHKVLLNDDLDECYEQLVALLFEWYPHIEGMAA